MFFSKKNQTKTPHSSDALKEYIEVYAHFKNDLAALKRHDHFDLIEETVIARASIHDCVQEAGKIDELTKSRIIALDKEWREWIIKNKREGFSLVDINRENVPKNEWWFWIDMLETLASEDLKTL